LANPPPRLEILPNDGTDPKSSLFAKDLALPVRTRFGTDSRGKATECSWKGETLP
jgi:hypothetical protein